MIEIDLLAAPTAPPSASVSPRAAHDFASALHDATSTKTAPVDADEAPAESLPDDAAPQEETPDETASATETPVPMVFESVAVASAVAADASTGSSPLGTSVAIGAAPHEQPAAPAADATSSAVASLDLALEDALEPPGETALSPHAGDATFDAEKPTQLAALVGADRSTGPVRATGGAETPDASAVAPEVTTDAGAPSARVPSSGPSPDAPPSPPVTTASGVASPAPAAAADSATVPPSAETPALTAEPLPGGEDGSATPTGSASVPGPEAGTATTPPSAGPPASALTMTALTGADAPSGPDLVSTAPAATPVDPAATAAELDVPTPPQQLAEALRDVRRMVDGSHRLSLQLYPEELGVVQLEVAVRDGQLHLRAATELDSTRRLIQAGLPELREHLAEAGVDAGSLEVGAETADHGGRDRGSRTPVPDPVGAGSPVVSPAASSAPTTPTDGRLDVRL